jgi:hypothetical protein
MAVRAPVMRFLLLGCLFGCGYSESYVQSGAPLPAKPETCEPRMAMPGEPIKEPFDVIGTLSLREGGFTSRCNYTQMLKMNRLKACAAGADAVQFLVIDPPSIMSTCYRSRANFIRFKREPGGSVAPQPNAARENVGQEQQGGHQ